MRHENYIKSLTENIKLKEEEKELDKEKLDIKKALLKVQRDVILGIIMEPR